MSVPLILDSVSKRYGSFVAVDSVSLELQPGEVFGFLGPNGAGKSTTIRMIMDFIEPSSGRIALFGKDSMEKRTKQHENIGYLAGDVKLYESMTGKNFLRFIARTGFDVDWIYVDKLSHRFEAVLDRPINTLSKGSRQKIGLLQAFMHQPKLLMLDEPTSGLDPLMKQVFYEMVEKAAKNGATVFLSSHDLTEVQKMCDRVGFIRQGKLIAVEQIATMKNMTTHRYIATFRKKFHAEEAKKIKSIENVERRGNELEFIVRGDVAEFVAYVAKFEPKTLRESELELEELFMKFYGEEASNDVSD